MKGIPYKEFILRGPGGGVCWFDFRLSFFVSDIFPSRSYEITGNVKLAKSKIFQIPKSDL